jgi:small-conductance mechanosensitive channel
MTPRAESVHKSNLVSFDQQPEDFPPEQSPEPVEVNPAAEAFYAGATARITRSMPLLAAAGTALTFWRVGGAFAAGFLIGCAIAYVNFYWLKRVVNALAERVTRSGQSESGRAAFTRFLLRYALIALAAYVILRVSTQSLYGMLAGLFLPVAAIACEAAYEVYVALRRGW